MNMSKPVSAKVYDLVNKLVDEDISKYSISAYNPNKKGEGYLGEITFITLQSRSNGKAYNFVLKQAFADEFIRTSNPIRDVFLNEIHFYTKIWPGMQKFQEEIANKNVFNKFPKCYSTSSEEFSEKLIFENLRSKGFEVFDKRKLFDKEHVEFIMKEYGKLHAISIAYRALNPEGYSKLAAGLKDMYALFTGMKPFQDGIRIMNELSLTSLKPGEDDEVIERFKRYVDNGVEIFRGSLQYKGKHPIILHGDCWSNNMMFKYDESRHLTDIRLLDLQLAKEGSPVSDLSYVLYAGGSKEILDDLNYYLEVYYDSLSDTVRAFGCDPEKLYPFKVLKDEWKDYCKLGFGMSLMLCKAKLTNDEDVVDLTDMTENNDELVEKFRVARYDEETFKKRSRDLILHMYENDFL